MKTNPGRLVALFHNKWALPVLAEMYSQGGGSKFVTLVQRLGVSRDSMSRTLRALVRHGWVLRNPGYGHPMRPEYVLTPEGTDLAPWCARVRRRLHRLGLGSDPLRKWSPAVAIAILSGGQRFSELVTALPGITSRALAQTLKSMQDMGLIERAVGSDYPPQVRYRLSPQGRRLAELLIEMPDSGSRSNPVVLP